MYTIVHKNKFWYQTETSPEKIFEGVVKRHQVPIGPNNRPASSKYALEIQEGDNTTLIPIYTPDGEEFLSEFVEQKVSLYGKIIDLSKEGFGSELWLGSISPINIDIHYIDSKRQTSLP
jgi:hypothetical protein